MVDAVVLAGGRSSRMNGADKTLATIDGHTLVDRAVEAVSFCRTVVVGPSSVPVSRPVLRTREEPHFGGPVRALAAGLTALTTTPASAVTVVLSADLPYITEAAVRRLVDTLGRSEADAVFATDSDGHLQYLVGAWRTDALHAGLARTDHGADATRQPAFRSLLPQRYTGIALVGVDDVDTAEDLLAARTAGIRPTLDRARSLIAERLRPKPVVVASLLDNLGGALAEPLRAATAFPRFPTSAMDGYAVVGSGPWRLTDTVVTAGDAATVHLAAGTAVRIATGAPVPAGASVVRDEFVDLAPPWVRLREDAPTRDDARSVGEDWSAGTQLAPVGTTITPAVASAALSAGIEKVMLRGPATVRLVLSGNEIVGDDRPLSDGMIRDTIGPVMPNYLHWCGFRVADTVHCEDSDEAFDRALTAPGPDGAVADVVVFVGATGSGAADRLQDMLIRHRTTSIVRGLALRPGGSTTVSTLPDGRVVLGVPGNPYAAVSTICILGPAVARAVTAQSPPTRITGRLLDAGDPPDVARSLPATHLGDDGWRAETSLRTAHLAALVGHDALAIIGPGDSPVEIVPLPRM